MSERNPLQLVASLQSGSVADIDGSLALEASRLNMPLADSLIYATAQRLGATVWTQDEDFRDLPGVRHFQK